MKNSIPLFLDSVFLFISSFILCVCLLNYFLPHPYHVVVSLTLSALVCLLGIKLLSNRSNKKKVTNKDKKLFTDTLIRLNLMKKEKLTALIIKALDIKNPVYFRDGFYHKESDTCYFIKFGFERLTKADIVKAFNERGEKSVFFCQEYDQEIKDFADRFNGKITLYDAHYLFNLLKEKNILPSNDFSSVYNEKQKVEFKNRLLEKRNAKKFLLFGAMLCLFSYFVPYKGYYLVWGSLMISFSIYLKLFGKTFDKH